MTLLIEAFSKGALLALIVLALYLAYKLLEVIDVHLTHTQEVSTQETLQVAMRRLRENAQVRSASPSRRWSD